MSFKFSFWIAFGILLLALPLQSSKLVGPTTTDRILFILQYWHQCKYDCLGFLFIDPDTLSCCLSLSPSHVWLSVTIAPRVIRSLKLHSAKRREIQGEGDLESQSQIDLKAVVERRLPRQGPQEYGGNDVQGTFTFETFGMAKVIANDDAVYSATFETILPAQ